MGRRRRRRLGAPLRPPASGGWCGSALWSCGSLKSLPLSEPGSEPAHGTPRKAPEQGPAHGRELAGHAALGLHVSQVMRPVLGSEKLAGAGDREQARSRALAGSLRASGRGGQPDGLHGAPGPGRSREPPPPRALGSWADLSVQGSGNRGSPGRFRTRLLGPRARSCDRPSPSLSSESTLDPRAF